MGMLCSTVNRQLVYLLLYLYLMMCLEWLHYLWTDESAYPTHSAVLNWWCAMGMLCSTVNHIATVVDTLAEGLEFDISTSFDTLLLDEFVIVTTVDI